MAELTTNINYLQPTGFAISISKENYPNIQYFAQSMSHPGITIAEIDQAFPRANVPMIGDKVRFDEVSFTFLLDENMETYNEMFGWINRIVNEQFKTAGDSMLNGISSEADITVTVLTSHNNANKQIKYINAFPINIGPVEFGTTNSEVIPLTFTASFKFSYFELR